MSLGPPLRAWPLGLGLAAALLGCGGEPAPRPPERIIALAPSPVEMLFALGLGERVVGVDDYSAFPPEVSTRPRLGALFNPNLEAIVVLEPDLVVLLASQRDLGERLRRLGVDSLVVESDTLAQTEAAIQAIARRCEVPEAGERLREELRAGLAPVAAPPGAGPPAAGAGPPAGDTPPAGDEATPGEQAGRRVRVLLSLEREPGRLGEVLSAGPGSFYAELLDRLGVENVFADLGSAFPRVGLEAILARRPEVIVEVQAEIPSAARRETFLADWRAFPDLPAVAAGRIEIVAGSHTLVPGPRLPLLYRDLRQAIFAGAAAAAYGAEPPPPSPHPSPPDAR